jgi:chromosome segregation ATPase
MGALMELVTMTEAAQKLGVSTDTIKRRLRRGELKGRKQPRPQGFTWLIELEVEFENDNGTQAATRAHTDASTDASTGALEHLEDLIVSLRSQVAAQQEQLLAKDHQIEQLHVLLQQAQAMLPAAKDNLSWWQKLWRRGRSVPYFR